MSNPATDIPLVAAARWPFRWARRRAAFVEEMTAALAPAVQHGAQLVVLPLHAGTALLGLWSEQVAALPLAQGLAAAATASGRPSLLQEVGVELRRLYGEVFGDLAASLGLWLVAGSLLYADQAGQLWHEAAVFRPTGAEAGAQRATHRTRLELSWGVRASEVLTPIASDVGALGLLIGDDVRYPEVSRILALQGTTVLVHLAAGGPCALPVRLAGLWREVQANQVFGIEACLAPGCAAVHCPVEMTADGRGLLAETDSGDAPAFAVAGLDATARQAVLATYDIAAFRNLVWYERIFPGVYINPMTKSTVRKL